MSRSAAFAALALVALPCTVAASCSAGSSGDPYGNGPGSTGGSGGAVEDASVIIETGPAGSGGMHVDIDVVQPDGTWIDGDTCIGLTVAAEPYPLDMYVMMDQSGSMSAPVGFSGKTQWKAIKDAFVDFLQKSPSSGLSMGIQYFPLPVVPWAQVPVCDQQNPSCASGSECLMLDNGAHCLKTCNGSCANGAECLSASGDAGSLHYCSNDSCDPAAYGAPEVEIAALPGNAAAIIASLDAHAPLTMTPSAPALEGAVQHARQWAQAHPDRTTVVVFATDGMPTVCTNDALLPINKVKEIAQQGVQGQPSIRTFVIGVGMMAANLHGVAASGGTGKAFIVQANQDMTAQFAAALDAIRGAMMECEFKIPQSGGLPDFDAVNVEYESTANVKTQLFYVGDASHCDPSVGGWYYDKDPAQGTPEKILLCPQNCDYIHKNGGSVHVIVGCKTIKPPR